MHCRMYSLANIKKLFRCDNYLGSVRNIRSVTFTFADVIKQICEMVCSPVQSLWKMLDENSNLMFVTGWAFLGI